MKDIGEKKGTIMLFWIIFFDILLVVMGLAACLPLLEIDKTIEEIEDDDEVIVML